MRTKNNKDKEFSERVIKINRITRVVKGGRRLRFRAIVAIGNQKGKVGLGIAKANEVSDAVSKAATAAKKNTIIIPMYNNTIPHTIIGKSRSTSILLKPAPEGTGIIAGGAVRDILEISGIKDIVAKSIGSRNKVNTSQATIDGLMKLRSQKEIFSSRNIEMPSKDSNKSTDSRKTTVKTKKNKPATNK